MTSYVPIDVTGTVTIPSGQSPVYSGSNGGEGAYFIDSTTGASTLILLGGLSVNDSTASDFVAGVTGGSSATTDAGYRSQFTIGHTGGVSVSGSGSGATTFGFFSTGLTGFENDGSFTV